MSVSVVIPWRPSAERAPLLDWVLDRYTARFPAWEIVVATSSPSRPWCKARTVTGGIMRARHDLIVVADADVWSDHLDLAVRAVRLGRARWAVPHFRVRRLDEATTAKVLTGADLDAVAGVALEGQGLEERAYIGVAGGGLTVVTRDLYDIAPLDPRFVGWGQEDESWGCALHVLGGPSWRNEQAPLWHLWHPSQPRRDRHVGSTEGKALRDRYFLAERPGLMRALIGEFAHGQDHGEPQGHTVAAVVP